MILLKLWQAAVLAVYLVFIAMVALALAGAIWLGMSKRRRRNENRHV